MYLQSLVWVGDFGKNARVHKGNIRIFKAHDGDLSKNHPNQTCDYWLITPN